MAPRLTPGARLQLAMDEALARAGEALGQSLEWDVDEKVILERAISAAERAEELRHRYRDVLAAEGSASALAKLSAEIRQLDRQVVELICRVNVGIGPAKSTRHVRAANARWARRKEA